MISCQLVDLKSRGRARRIYHRNNCEVEAVPWSGLIGGPSITPNSKSRLFGFQQYSEHHYITVAFSSGHGLETAVESDLRTLILQTIMTINKKWFSQIVSLDSFPDKRRHANWCLCWQSQRRVCIYNERCDSAPYKGLISISFCYEEIRVFVK